MSLEANERHCRNYDSEGVWHIDVYDRRSAAILDKLGAKRIDTGYDGDSYDCTPQQAIEYIAEYHGLIVEFRQRRRQQLSAEERQRRSERMKAIRAAN